MSRAKNLDDQDVAKIVGILDGWSGRLSWELLVEAIEKRLFSRYTRQALHKHGRIKDAFALRKGSLAKSGDAPRKLEGSPELQAAMARIERLKAENERLEAENTRLLEQFVRWAFNANLRGLDNNFLSQPLPTVDREQTRSRRKREDATSLAGKN